MFISRWSRFSLISTAYRISCFREILYYNNFKTWQFTNSLYKSFYCSLYSSSKVNVQLSIISWRSKSFGFEHQTFVLILALNVHKECFSLPHINSMPPNRWRNLHLLGTSLLLSTYIGFCGLRIAIRILRAFWAWMLNFNKRGLFQRKAHEWNWFLYWSSLTFEMKLFEHYT